MSSNLTLEQTQAALIKLKKIRATGAGTVKHGDETVVYRSLSEINEAIALLEGELAGLEGTPRRVSYMFQSGKGL